MGPKKQDCKREYENVGNMARRVELQPCVNAVETKVMAAIRQHPENVAAVTGDRCNCSNGQSKLSRTVCRHRSSFLQEPILFFFYSLSRITFPHLFLSIQCDPYDSQTPRNFQQYEKMAHGALSKTPLNKTANLKLDTRHPKIYQEQRLR